MHKFFDLKKIFLGLLLPTLFFTNAVSASPSFGLYFSPVSFTENGFLILGIEISKQKKAGNFLAQELRYHQENAWEEVIFAGNVEEEATELVLKPNSCQVRASRDFGEKKGLVRRFDCLHLSFRLKETNKDTFQITSSLLGTLTFLPLQTWIPEVTGEPVAISFLLPGPKQEEGVWGFHLNGIGKNPPVQIWNQKGKKWDRFQTFETNPSQAIYNIYRWRRSFSD